MPELEHIRCDREQILMDADSYSTMCSFLIAVSFRPGYRLEVKTASSGEALKGDSPSWITPGNGDVTFLLVIACALEFMKRGMIILVGGTGFGRL